jgi:3-keto-disaccharide hydrolase
MNQRLTIAAASLGIVLVALGCASQPYGDTGANWVTLIDGTTGLDNWIRVGDANWRAVDGTIQADQKTDKANSFLVTKDSYTDFRIRAEFWVSDDANSGIYMRCADIKNLTDRTCYEANIFDQRLDPTFGTGSIVHLSPVSPMPKAGGKWNTYDVTVKGSRVTVRLNGVVTADIQDSKLTSGPVALQYAAGVVKFRKVQITPL